jgi:hypothetical protein
LQLKLQNIQKSGFTDSFFVITIVAGSFQLFAADSQGRGMHAPTMRFSGIEIA